MRKRLLVSSFALLLVIASVVIVVVNLQGRMARSNLTPGSVINFPNGGVDPVQENALRQLLSVFTSTPNMPQANLGPGTKSVAYREQWVIGDALVTPDGTLYVTVASPSSPGETDHYAVGTLWLGRLQIIPLPRAARGYISMVFVGDGRTAILQAGDPDRGFRLFLLSPTTASELPYREISQRPDHSMLASGESCEQSQDQNSPVVLMAVNRMGTTHPVLTRKTLSMATGGALVDDRYISMYCSSFGGQDFVTMVAGGDWAVTFRLLPGNLRLVTRGRVAAAGPRHILITQREQGPQGATGFEDYFEAIK